MTVARKKATHQKVKKRKAKPAVVREVVTMYGLTRGAVEQLFKKAAQPVKKSGPRAS